MYEEKIKEVQQACELLFEELHFEEYVYLRFVLDMDDTKKVYDLMLFKIKELGF